MFTKDNYYEAKIKWKQVTHTPANVAIWSQSLIDDQVHHVIDQEINFVILYLVFQQFWLEKLEGTHESRLLE